jgi:hypothetical protein
MENKQTTVPQPTIVSFQILLDLKLHIRVFLVLSAKPYRNVSNVDLI